MAMMQANLQQQQMEAASQDDQWQDTEQWQETDAEEAMDDAAQGGSEPFDWSSFDWSKGFFNKDGDDEDHVDPASMTAEQLEDKIGKALQQAQTRFAAGKARDAEAAEAQASAQGRRGKATRSPPEDPSNFEAKIQQNMQAAMKRGAVARQEQQHKQQQDEWQQEWQQHQQQTSRSPMKVKVAAGSADSTPSSLDSLSVEAKVAEALAAARQRSSGSAAAAATNGGGAERGSGGGRTGGGGGRGGAGSRGAGPTPAVPTTQAEMQAKFAAALEAAKTRRG